MNYLLYTGRVPIKVGDEGFLSGVERPYYYSDSQSLVEIRGITNPFSSTQFTGVYWFNCFQYQFSLGSMFRFTYTGDMSTGRQWLYGKYVSTSDGFTE